MTPPNDPLIGLIWILASLFGLVLGVYLVGVPMWYICEWAIKKLRNGSSRQKP